MAIDTRGYLKYGVDVSVPRKPMEEGIDSNQDAKLDSRKYLIENVRVFDGYVFDQPTSVAMEHGKIVEGTSDAAIRIAGNGGFLLPGFIDCHAHPAKVADLEAFREYGITTVMEVGNSDGAVGKAMKGLVGLPDLYCAGHPAAPEDGSHSKVMNLPKEALPSNPAEAVQFIAQRVADGADYIKIISDLPGLDQITVNTLVNQAKQNGLLTHVHAVELESYRKGRRARASMVHHVPCDAALTMEEASTGSDYVAVPTIAIIKTMTDKMMSDKPEAVRVPIESVRALRNAGIPILAGSDANLIKDSPVQLPFGDSFHQEMELLVEAVGLSPVEALRAATVLPPKYFRLPDRGTIKPGMRADLVLLRENPLENIRATRSIERVWLNGVEHSPSKPHAAS